MDAAQGGVTRAEWRWVAIAAGLVMALTCVPYVVGAAASNEAWRFTGFVLNVADGNSYIAKMQWGAAGNLLFKLPYTAVEHDGVLIYSFFIWLGWAVGVVMGWLGPLGLHSALVMTYHVVRVAVGFGLLLVGYRWVAAFVDDVWWRRLGWVMLALGGGLGWLQLALMGNSGWPPPVEIYSPEAFTFLMMFLLPHLTFARLCWMAGLLTYVRGLEGGGWRWPLATSVLWLLAALAQPGGLPLAFGLIGAQSLLLMVLSIWRDDEVDATPGKFAPLVGRSLWMGPVAALPALMLVVYTLAVLVLSPVFQAWNAQNVLTPSPVVDYVFAWGLLMIGAVLGLRPLWRRNRLLAMVAVVWLVVIPVLLYAPTPFQRRIVEGYQWLLVGLAVAGLSQVRWQRVARMLAVAGVAVSVPGALLIVFFGTLTASEPLRMPDGPVSRAFTPTHEVAAFAFIAERLGERAPVVAAPDVANVLPAYAPVVGIGGHGVETINYAESAERIMTLYLPTTRDWERYEAWVGLGAPYVIVGPSEADAYNGAFDPQYVTGDFRAPIAPIYAWEGVSVWALDEGR